MRKTLYLLMAILLLTGCSQETHKTVNSEIASEGQVDLPSFVEQEEIVKRIIQGYLHENQLWLILRDFAYTGTSEIIRYQLSGSEHEIDLNSQYQCIYQDIELGMHPEIVVEDNMLSFRGDDSAILHDLETHDQVFQYIKYGRTLPTRTYDTLCNKYINVEEPDRAIVVRGAANHDLIKDGIYAGRQVQYFKWGPRDNKFTYLADQSEINIVTLSETEIRVIQLYTPFWEFEPEGLIEYTNLFWSADGAYLILEAMCEDGMRLQSISIELNEVINEYVFENKGSLMAVEYGNQVLLLDDNESRNLLLWDYKTGDEKVFVHTDEYIHFAMINRSENKLVYDLYNPETKKQVVRIMEVIPTVSFDILVDLIKSSIDERSELTFYPKRDVMMVYNSDGTASIVLGYTINNNYYYGLFKIHDMNDVEEWEYVKSELVLEDVQRYIDQAAEALFEKFHKKEYGDNLLEVRVAQSTFEGGDLNRYTVYVEYEFEVKPDYVVKCAGNIRNLKASGWYSGAHFITMVLDNGEYVLESFSTSP